MNLSHNGRESAVIALVTGCIAISTQFTALAFSFDGVPPGNERIAERRQVATGSLVKAAYPSCHAKSAIPRSCGPPKVDILPSTRKRISSGCAGSGRLSRQLRPGFSRRRFRLLRDARFLRRTPGSWFARLDLRLRGGIRRYLLRRWPGVTASISKRFQDPAVEAAQNVPH